MQCNNSYIILRECFSSQRTGNPVRIQEIFRKKNYIQVFEENLKESADKL